MKMRTLERIARSLRHHSVVLIFPHIIKEPDENIKKRTCPAAYKLMVSYDQIQMSPVDQMDIFVTLEQFAEVSPL